MRRAKLHHVIIGEATHRDCPLCMVQSPGTSAAHAAPSAPVTRQAHPAECPCRFCAPLTSPYVLAPLRPWEDEVIDVAEGQADGSMRIHASYRVDRDGSITWLTPDGLPPKQMMS